MANHGSVKTRKPMKPEQITALIEELNKSLFKEGLQIEYHQNVESNRPHIWVLNYIYGEENWASRTCWLNTSRHFEMRHGGGGLFAWWIDQVIQNEIAVRFNGVMTDEGTSAKQKGVPGKFHKLSDFMESMFSHANPTMKKQFLEWEYEMVPPKFRS